MGVFNFNVEMTCEGCSSAVERILNRQKEKQAVQDFKVDLPAKTVSVTTNLPLDEIKAILEKSGKSVSFVSES